MQESALTSVALPLALGVIMLGMGMGLTPQDFLRVARYPRGVAAGLAGQLVVLPLLAFFLVWALPISPGLGLGIVLIAACPGGATSNLLAHLARGDAALSISLTALSSVVTVVSIPFLVNLALAMQYGEGAYVPLPVAKTIVQVFGITLLPVALGMSLRARRPDLAERSERPVRWLSAVLLIAIVLAAILKERANLASFFAQAGPAALLLNVGALGAGWGLGRLAGVDRSQRVTLVIEVGIQNGTLGIAIAATLLKNSEAAIPPAIYSLIMFGTAALTIWWANRAAPRLAQA